MGLFDKVLDTVKVVAEPFKAASPVIPFVNAALSAFGGQRQNVASAQAAQRQMDFQREMSDTSFQRQIADLKAAGVNPMLISRLGGSSTPMGAMPIVVNPFAEGARAFSAAQQSGAAALQAETSMFLSEAQYKQIDAAADKIREEIKNIPIEGDRLRAAVDMVGQLAALYQQQGITQQDQQRMLKATVQKLVQETELLSGSVQAMKSLDNLGKTAEALKPIIDIFKIFLAR